MARSRLSRQMERKTKKTLVLSVIGILVVLFLFAKFAIPFIANGGLMSKDTPETKSSTNKTSFIAPPTLDPTYTATNSATTSIKGSGQPKQTIDLYVNNELVTKDTADDKGNFSFDSIKLSNGQNTIQAKAENDQKKQSDFSNTITISYSNKQPSLSVDSPSDGQTFSKDQNTTQVTGKTDPGNKVTVNDFWAIVDDSGKYTYTLNLKSGDNQITVIATDDAGNTTKQQRKVTYNP